MSEQDNEAVVRRFYEELWNGWRTELADEILAPEVRFRGTLGSWTTGRDAFVAYLERVRSAFPDWHNQIDELLAIGDRVVARLTWTGTHTGPLGDIAPTHARVSYVGAAFFRIIEGRIGEAWVVGDTQELWRGLGQLKA